MVSRFHSFWACGEAVEGWKDVAEQSHLPCGSQKAEREKEWEDGQGQGQDMPFQGVPLGSTSSKEVLSPTVSTTSQQCHQIGVPQWINPLLRSELS